MKKKSNLLRCAALVLCCVLLAGFLPAGVFAQDGHTHTDECYIETRVLTCGQDHIHTEECYSVSVEPVCGLEESGRLLGAPASSEYLVSTAQELADAVSAINGADSGEFVIRLADDIDYSGTLSFRKNTAVLIGNGHTLDFGNSEVAITVSSGTDDPVLILGDKEDPSNTLTLTSDGQPRQGRQFLVVGSPGNGGDKGTAKMYDGVTITGAVTNNAFGGGVLVGRCGTFEMNGGLITRCGVEGGSVCHGGGAAVISGGVFTMNGGTISHCFARSEYDGGNGWQVPSATGGGVFVGNGSTFVMNGGSIEYNEATWDGGGVMVMNSRKSASSGWGYLDSKFVMTDGTILGNEAGYVGGGLAVLGTYINAYGIAAPTPAGGSPSDPGIYISGGTIRGNDAANGGGIFLNWIQPSIPMKIHNAAIDQNTAEVGAGINVLSYWTQADIDNCAVTGNRAEQNGGGIALTGNSSSAGTTLKNSTVTGNTSGADGAGIYYDADSKLTISGANTIQDNLLNGKRNNLNIYDETHPVYVSGSLTGSRIGLSDPKLWRDSLSDDDASAASADKLTSGYQTGNGSVDPYEVFTSDHETWYPYWGGKDEGTFSEDWSNSGWSEKTGLKYNNYVGGVAQAGSMTGQKNNLRYDPASNTIVDSGVTAGTYQLAIVQDGSDYYLAYKYASGKYYILTKLTMVEGTTRYFPIPDTLNRSDLLAEANIGYIRCGSLNSLRSSYVYSFQKVSNGDGYDYSGEVRLIRTAYTLHYNDSVTPDASDYYVPTAQADLPVPTRLGYSFGGWYAARDLSGEAVTRTPGAYMGDVDYYARWIPDLRVSFDLNYQNATGAPEPQSVVSGGFAREPEAPSREGFRFDGWYEDPECTRKFDFGAPVAADVTLYAKWLKTASPVTPTAAAYRVERYQEQPDGTYQLVETEFPLYGEIGSTVSAAEKTYEHYHLNSEKSLMSGQVIMPEQENSGVKILTLAVYYDLDLFPVSYDLNGGKGADGVDYSTETVKYGSEVTVKAQPARDGFTFTGWSDGEKTYDAGASLTVLGGVTLQAQWQEAGKPADPNSPSTGDNSHMGLWIALLAAGIFGAAAMTLLVTAYGKKGKYSK